MSGDIFSRFLDGQVLASEFAREIQEEVRKYREGLSRIGSSIHLAHAKNQAGVVIGPRALIRICEAYLAGQFSRWDVHYVCDALSVSDAEYCSERLRDLIDQFSDPEIRAFQLSVDEVRAVRDELQLMESD